jgi:hypothetical protein
MFPFSGVVRFPRLIFFSSSPMFFTKNETSCSIQSLMRPLLWLAQVLAKHHQQPHTDPQLHNLSSHCCLFLPAPHSQCPKMTFLNRVRCFRSNLSRLSTLLFLFSLFFGFLCCSFISSFYLFIFIPFEIPTNLDLLSTLPMIYSSTTTLSIPSILFLHLP